MEKCDEKQAISFASALSPKVIKRPLPVPPPVPPTSPPPTRRRPRDDPNDDDSKHDTEDQSVAPSNVERKQKKRRTRSLERLRDQSINDIELSDSDEDIAIALKIPIIKTSPVDEPDHASATSPSMSDAFNALSNSTVDEPAICIDSPGMANNTFSDKSQLSYDEILKIEESFDDDGANGFMNRSIVVDIHSEPTIELRIHESDSDPAIQASKSVPGILNASKVTKEQINADFEQERCYSEDDAIDLDGDADNKEKPERLVQSDSEVLSKTPLELVVECDINENVIVSETKPREIIDLDHNHNDIVKSVDILDKERNPIDSNESHLDTNDDTKLVQNRESQSIVRENERPRRESISSRSSCSESDGNEPVYATVDTTLNNNTVSFSSLTEKATEPEKNAWHFCGFAEKKLSEFNETEQFPSEKINIFFQSEITYMNCTNNCYCFNLKNQISVQVQLKYTI